MQNVLPLSIERVLVLGHSGFIGSPLIEKLGKINPKLNVTGLSSADCDLANPLSAERLPSFFDDTTAVLVCSGIKKQWGDSLDIFNKNLLMITNLCQALEKKSVRRLLYFSSAEVYGDEIDNLCMNEMTPVSPSSFYGIAKYTSELLLRKTCERLGISLLLLRPPLVYGIGDSSSGYGPSGFIRAALKGEKITLWGDGTELRSMIFIDDLVDIVCHIAFSEHEGVVNVANPESVSFIEIIRMLSTTLAKDIECDFKPRTKPKIDNGYSTELLHSIITDFRFTSLKTGISKTIDSIKRLESKKYD